MRTLFFGAAVFLLSPAALGAQRPAVGSVASQYVAVDAPVVALTNVTIIDGTGRPPKPGQTIVMSGNRIQAVGAVGSVAVPPERECSTSPATPSFPG